MIELNILPDGLSEVLFFITLTLFLIYYLWIRRSLSARNQSLINSLEERNRALTTTSHLNAIIFQTLDYKVLAQKIANAIPELLGYKTGVLAIVDEDKGVLKRVAISETSGGAAALKSLEIPFSSIEIKLTSKENYCIKALAENRVLVTSNLYDVLRPAVSVENSEIVQSMMETKTTLVYPIYSLDHRPLGTFLVSMEQEEKDITEYERLAIGNFVEGVKIALVNAQLYTSLKDAMRELSKANTKLEELDRLKDDFVSVASHELRTPMTVVKSYLWMALHKPDIELSERMIKYINRAYISTERLINLVNDMLNVSRIEGGRIEIKPKAFDMKAFAEDIITEIRPKLAEKNLEAEVAQETVPNVFADPDKTHEVLLNLLGNALKYTNPGGKIKISFFSDGQTVETSVTDNGIGIDQDDLPRLFQKFGRLDNSYVAAATSSGTGLGLYICKNLVELMKGKIWAKSAGLGRGATFTFSLPAATPAVLSEAQQYSKQAEGEAKQLEPASI